MRTRPPLYFQTDFSLLGRAERKGVASGSTKRSARERKAGCRRDIGFPIEESLTLWECRKKRFALDSGGRAARLRLERQDRGARVGRQELLGGIGVTAKR